VLDLAGAVMMVATLVRRETENGASTPLIVSGAVLMLVGSVWMAAAAILWRATEITVTSRRVFIKTGVLSRHTKEVLLAKIESVSVEESMAARLLGFGRVTIHGTGGTPEVFDRIARPHEVRRQVQIQIEALSGPGQASIR
jgi:uncharacterized membrane protein YdbT with pleckstrin-like domain